MIQGRLDPEGQPLVEGLLIVPSREIRETLTFEVNLRLPQTVIGSDDVRRLGLDGGEQEMQTELRFDRGEHALTNSVTVLVADPNYRNETRSCLGRDLTRHWNVKINADNCAVVYEPYDRPDKLLPPEPKRSEHHPPETISQAFTIDCLQDCSDRLNINMGIPAQVFRWIADTHIGLEGLPDILDTYPGTVIPAEVKGRAMEFRAQSYISYAGKVNIWMTAVNPSSELSIVASCRFAWADESEAGRYAQMQVRDRIIEEAHQDSPG